MIRRDDGMVTVEAAMVLPLLIVFALAAVVMIGLAVTRLRCADLAHESARAAARGQAGPSSGTAHITLSRQGQTETATVRMVLHPAGWLPSVTIVETVTAAIEPSAGGS